MGTTTSLGSLCQKPLCFQEIKPGVPAISETPKCQEVLQDYMKNKNNEKHDFLIDTSGPAGRDQALPFSTFISP